MDKSTAVITAKTGPDRQVAALQHNDVREFTLVLGGKSLMRIHDGEKGITEFDLAPLGNVTITITGGIATITAT